jgi:asparagine synthase (glutamine-hydrolysing)
VSDRRDAAERFAGALRLSVQQHLRSDVPVGCALSGGLDSTAVAALVRELDPHGDLNTFTATFPGAAIDERRWVDDALEVVDARPHFVNPSGERFAAEADAFVYAHDEPVGSLSQYAGWCVARLTREARVPVTLNGQGGDEVLGGYWQSYFTYLRAAARHGRAWTLARHFLGSLQGGNPELLRQVPVMLRRYRSRRGSAATLEHVLSMSEQERRVFEIRELYLPRLLKWDDRNFMAFSVEGRYPFLDHALIELTLSFTPEVLYRRGWVKEPLRRGLAGVLPPSIARRRSKLGFETPQEEWLRGALRPPLERLSDGSSPLWRYTSKGPAQQLIRAALAPDASVEACQAAFRHFCADRWLQVFFEGAAAAPAAA